MVQAGLFAASFLNEILHTRMAGAGESNNQRSCFSSGRSETVFVRRDCKKAFLMKKTICLPFA